MKEVSPDLVERMRKHLGTDNITELLDDGADAIVTLQAERDDLKRQVLWWCNLRPDGRTRRFPSGCACSINDDEETIDQWCALHAGIRDALQAERDAEKLKRQQAEHERDSILEDLAGSQREQAGLRKVLTTAGEHIAELREAWQRGCISEHDGKGGTRSNRNMELDRIIRAALRGTP